MTTEPFAPPTLIKHEHIETIYLAGPMSRIFEFNYPAFFTHAEALEAVGYTVFNPAAYGGLDTTGLDGTEKVPGFNLREAFAAYTKFITTQADAVAVLPGWENSPGARGEVFLALAIALPVIDATTGELLDIDTQITVTPRVDAERAASMARHPAGKAVKAGAPRLTVAETLDKTEAPAPSQSPSGVGYIPAAGEIRMTSPTGGQKGSKEAAYDLVPSGPLKELAVLFGRGNGKYFCEPGQLPNWKLGYDWSLSKAALLRHFELFWAGEDYDEEMGVKHVINVAWHCFVLAWFMENRPEFDNRPHQISDEKYVGALPTPQWLLDLQAERAALRG